MTETHPPTAMHELFVSLANAEWRSADELGAWLAGEALVDERPGTRRIARELEAFDKLRALVRSVADRLDAGLPATRTQVAALNRAMRAAPQVPALRIASDGPQLGAVALATPYAEARASVARSLAAYLAHGDPRRLRRCASETCRWVFIDRSRSGRRRWCEMGVCGNRAKVRRYRARAKGTIAGPDSVRQRGSAGLE